MKPIMYKCIGISSLETAAFNSAGVNSDFLALFISGSEVIKLNISYITLSLSFLALVMIFSAQKYLYKTIVIVVSLIWNLLYTKRCLDYINSYDEGSARLI